MTTSVRFKVTKIVPHAGGGLQISLKPLAPAEGRQVAAPMSRGTIELKGLEKEAARGFTLGAVVAVTIEVVKDE